MIIDLSIFPEALQQALLNQPETLEIIHNGKAIVKFQADKYPEVRKGSALEVLLNMDYPTLPNLELETYRSPQSEYEEGLFD